MKTKKQNQMKVMPGSGTSYKYVKC